MGTIEIILISVAGVVALYVIIKILFSVRKKSGDKKKVKDKGSKKTEAVVEQAIKPEKKQEPKEENKEGDTQLTQVGEKQLEKEKTLEKSEPFHIIRRKSEVKINKKALKANSRNPSVTRVFDKNGKKIDENIEETTKEPIEEKQDVVKIAPKQPLEPFSAKDYEYSEESSEKEFKINPPSGSPQRAPMLQDRTNFQGHLNISEDGNLSGVAGTGIGKAALQAEVGAKKLSDKTEDMISRVQESVLSNSIGYNPMMAEQSRPQSPKSRNIIESIDAETLFLAEVLNKPKFKRPQDGDGKKE